MGKRLFRWGVAGALWTAAAGTLLHFVYEWSGESVWAAVFSGVNESVWEHMKLLVMPLFLFTAVQVAVLGDRYPGLPGARAVSLIAGMTLIPVLYYTYTGVLGFRISWVDISIFYVAVLAWLLLDWKLLRSGRLESPWVQVLGIIVLWLVVFAFVWCTFHPPGLALWQEPVTGIFGIPR